MLLALLTLAGCSDQPPTERRGVSRDSPQPLPPSDRVNRPVTVPAAEARLADDEVVGGVVVGGKARAYRLGAFKFVAYHVVNDVIDNTAVTVTYCDRYGCLRAFAADGDEPLPVGVGGFHDGLLLRIGDSDYRQKTGRTADGKELPYRTMPVERTEWGAWKKAHPDTDVYIGSSAAPGTSDERPPPSSRPKKGDG
jgi:hypothetical protein